MAEPLYSETELQVVEYSSTQDCFHYSPHIGYSERYPERGDDWYTVGTVPLNEVLDFIDRKRAEMQNSIVDEKAPHSNWQRTRLLVLKRDRYTCTLCGRSAEDGAKLEAGHIIARSRGGSDEMDNLKTMCFDCNRGMRTDEP